MPGKKNKNYTFYYVLYLLVGWTLYRYFFNLPVLAEEFLIKPIIWLSPVVLLLRAEKKSFESIGFTSKNLFKGIYLALALGAVFAIEALLINFAKYDGFNFSANIGDQAVVLALITSFATAFTEEISFRGYIFTRIWDKVKSELVANLVTSTFWALIHLPIVLFVWQLDFGSALTYLILTTIFGVGSAFIFARTRNIFSSILLHVLWEWPIILFR